MGTVSAQPLGAGTFCTECGRRHAAEDLARFGASAVCLECKPLFLQRMREGAAAPAAVAYAGFWRRFLAVLLDAIILSIINFPIQMALGAFVGPGLLKPGQTTSALGMVGLIYFLSFGIGFAYETYFISQKGATPGKMVLGVKVVTAGGGPVSVGRAAGRYFAKLLSGIILGLGYIIAAFDAQKRALHDHICNTLVIRQH